MAKRGVKTNAPARSNKRVKKALKTPLGLDRFSKLPDPVIQHILSFLPTLDVVRTSLLSKRWRYMWYSVPTLSFSDRTTAFESLRGKKLFYKYVDNCLKHRKRGMRSMADSVITSVTLEMDYCERAYAYVGKWLDFVVKSKVKELNLRLNPFTLENESYYLLPETVINAKYLTILELERLDLGCYHTCSLPSLKTLSLIDVGDVQLDKLMLGCPSLEKFLFSDFYCLDIAPFRNSSLKFLELENFEGIVLVQVEAINLESLVLVEGCFPEMNVSACKTVRNLSLLCVSGITDQSLEDLISELPLLETLNLSNNVGLKHIKISCENLKTFSLKNDGSEELKVTIELAPNLVSFCYEGNLKLSLSMESSTLLNGNFVIHEWPEKYGSKWYINLINFLLDLNFSWNVLRLHVRNDEALILPRNLKRICRSPLPDLKHLRVITKWKPKRESDLRDALLWISPCLETLFINQKSVNIK